MAIENKNLKYLDELPPEVKAKFIKVIEKMNERGYSVQLNDSFRTFEEQFEIWKGNVELAATPGNSMHETGLAFDFNIIDKNGKSFGMASSPSEWESTGIPTLFNNEGMRWGGDFGFYDGLEELRKQKISLERDLEISRQYSAKENPLANLLGENKESQRERDLKDWIAQLENEINAALKKRDKIFSKNKQYDPIHGDLKDNDAFKSLSKTRVPLSKDQKAIQDYCRLIKETIIKARKNISKRNIGDFYVSEETKRTA